MNDTAVIHIAVEALLVAGKLAAPVLVTSLVVGFAVSLFQSVTQIQESTLSFVPKAAAIGAVLVFAGNWMLHEVVAYTEQLYAQIPALINGA